MINEALKAAQDAKQLSGDGDNAGVFAMAFLLVVAAIDKGWLLVRRVTGVSMECMDKKIGHIEEVVCASSQRQQEQCIGSLARLTDATNHGNALMEKMLVHLEIMSGQKK